MMDLRAFSANAPCPSSRLLGDPKQPIQLVAYGGNSILLHSCNTFFKVVKVGASKVEISVSMLEVEWSQATCKKKFGKSHKNSRNHGKSREITEKSKYFVK